MSYSWPEGHQQQSTKEAREREEYTQKHRLGARTAGPSGLHGEAAGQHPDATHLYPTDSYGSTRRAAGPQPPSVNRERGRERTQRRRSYRPGKRSSTSSGPEELNWASSKRVEGGRVAFRGELRRWTWDEAARVERRQDSRLVRLIGGLSSSATASFGGDGGCW